MSQIFISSLSLENLFSINGLSTATGYRYIKTIDDILSPLNIDLWRYWFSGSIGRIYVNEKKKINKTI